MQYVKQEHIDNICGYSFPGLVLKSEAVWLLQLGGRDTEAVWRWDGGEGKHSGWPQAGRVKAEGAERGRKEGARAAGRRREINTYKQTFSELRRLQLLNAIRM